MKLSCLKGQPSLSFHTLLVNNTGMITDLKRSVTLSSNSNLAAGTILKRYNPRFHDLISAFVANLKHNSKAWKLETPTFLHSLICSQPTLTLWSSCPIQLFVRHFLFHLKIYSNADKIVLESAAILLNIGLARTHFEKFIQNSDKPGSSIY